MRTWATLEHFYGTLYMRALRRRVIVTMLLVFVVGLTLGWCARSFALPSPPKNVRILPHG